VFSTIVSETLRTLNVAPDSNVNQAMLEDKNSVDIQSAAVKTNAAVLKR
jgi:cell division protein FtsI (penicillin-binding protein 3)